MDREALRAAQVITASRWNERAWLHAGGLAWNVATAADPGDLVASADGWAWLQPSGELWLQGDVTDLLAWAVGTATADELVAAAADRDAEVIAALRAAGFEEAPDLPFDLVVHRRRPPVDPEVPDGWRLATADDVLPQVLVDAHRSAWRPADLPFAEGHRPPVDPAATSAFDHDRLARVQTTWPYRPDLHVVALGPGGVPGASCIAWLDERTGAAEIEPLGTNAAHRRLGLGAAVCLEAVRRATAAGADVVMIHPRGDAAYPAPRRLYAACGFGTVDRTRSYRRVLRVR